LRPSLLDIRVGAVRDPAGSPRGLDIAHVVIVPCGLVRGVSRPALLPIEYISVDCVTER
jgi:hypothetical protein